MHAPAEVEPQFHRRRPTLHQPIRRRGCKIERHNKTVAQLPRQNSLSAQLLLAIGQANQRGLALILQNLAKEADVGARQRCFGALQYPFIYLLGATGTGYLQRRIGRVQVGCRVVEPGSHHQQNKDIFPEWVTIHPSLIYATRGE